MTNIEDFNKSLLATQKLEERITFLRKYIFHGTPFIFENDEAKYFEFRNRIATKFGIGYQEIFIVGSAKLGYSYTKGTTFSLNSDVDTVIVNENLFEIFYQSICDYQYDLDKFYKTPTHFEYEQYMKFLQYLVKGWMRPDLLPVSFQKKIQKDDWFEFFNSISNNKSEIGNYKVNAGLFKNYYYLEKYYLNGIEETYKKLKQLSNGETITIKPKQ